jgi:hypothetical protein
MTKQRLLKLLSELPNDCEVLIPGPHGLEPIDNVTIYQDNEPAFAVLEWSHA